MKALITLSFSLLFGAFQVNSQLLLNSSSPQTNTINISRSAAITLEFNETINPGSVEDGIFIYSNLRGHIEGSFMASGNIVTFTGAKDFIVSEDIVVSISTSVSSNLGSTLLTPISIHFVIESGLSQATPVVFKDFELIRNPSAIFEAIDAADLDSDDDIDIVFAANTQIGWLKNDGSGGFEHNIISEIGGSLTDIRAVDIDNDLDIDLIIGSLYDGVRIYRNDGSQNFSFALAVNTMYKSIGLVVADFDSNGFADVVFSDASGSNPQGTHILFNQDGFQFEDIKISDFLSYTTRVIDIDYDGDLDLILHSSNEIRYLLNNSGVFDSHTITFSDSITDFVAEDFDNDGDIDIISIDDMKLNLYENDGANQFTRRNLVSNAIYPHLIAGDFDGDGDSDLIIPEYDQFYIHENDGNGNFTIRQIVSLPYDGLGGSSIYRMAFADLDNDQDIDFFSITNYFRIVLFKNTTLFEAYPVELDSQPNFKPVTVGSSDWGDFDNDGDLDLIVTGLHNHQPSTTLYRNDNGVFEEVATIIDNVYFGSCDWGDYDHDGDLDIVIIGATSVDLPVRDPIFKIYNNEGAEFTPVSIELEGTYHGEVRWADLNNDGHLDIVVNGMFHSAIYKSNGSGMFEKIFELPSIFAEGKLDFADYDNDGDLDIAISGFRGNPELGTPISLYRNDGEFNFTVTNQDFDDLASGSLIWADIDSDGDSDLIDAVFYLNSLGQFTKLNNSVDLYISGGSAAGDFDNDGIPDLVTLLPGVTAILHNNGQGDLTDYQAEVPGIFSGFVNWVDYDNDQDLDIVTDNNWFKNNNNVANQRPLPPDILGDSTFNNILYLFWNEGIDVETAVPGLSYNVYVGSTSQSQDILNSNSFIPEGVRKDLGFGHAKGRMWKLSDLQNGTYYYGVQTIDAAYYGSQFSIEKEALFLKINGPVNVCAGMEIDYSVDVPGEYVWEAIGGTILSGQGTATVAINWSDPGNRYIRVTNATNKRNTLLVTIDAKPNPVITGELVACSGELSYEIADINSYNPSWSIIGGELIDGNGSNKVIINWIEGGLNSTSAQVSSANNGCEVSTEISVAVDITPEPKIVGAPKVCQGYEEEYSTSSPSVVWSATGGTVVVENDAMIMVVWDGLEKSGTVTALEYSKNRYCSSQTSMSIEIGQPPQKPTVEILQGKLRSSLSEHYQWYFENEAIENAETREIEITNAGAYKVESINSYGCKVFSDAILITQIENDELDRVNAFPNPTSSTLEVNLSKWNSPGSMIIYILNSSGDEVINIKLDLEITQTQIRIDVSKLPSGLYYLVLNDDNKLSSSKFVKNS